MSEPMTLADRRRANTRFLEAQSDHELARHEADTAERLRDEAEASLRGARERRDRRGEAMRAAFADLPADLQELYR